MVPHAIIGDVGDGSLHSHQTFLVAGRALRPSLRPRTWPLGTPVVAASDTWALCRPWGACVHKGPRAESELAPVGAKEAA